ncbi:putative mesothelin [Scophthalmus maximus]|uniref:Putative mesothelin n=1 Tax=Scophthalmus maximus TaxID=52904 RepID=A0A2U9BMD0_SCOMX|nr:putative mesothelin [Scophthalmus maximus]
MHQNITLAFHKLLKLTDAVENVAHVLHCAARANLTMSEETSMRLIVELTERLNSLLMELSTTNFTKLASDFRPIFDEPETPSLTEEHLRDPAFIELWFKTKLMPLLPDLEVLHLLSPEQIAEMLLLPLPAPPGKGVVVDRAFDFLTEFPGKFPEVLHHLVRLAAECPVTHFNASLVCGGIDSSDLKSYLTTSVSAAAPCNFTLEQYACARLENFTANQLASLLKCDLPGNSSHSKMLWKMLLTKLSNVLDPALDILANVSMTAVGPSASEVLDVIGEIRVSLLTDEQLKNGSEIRQWFSGRLSGFLPSASGRFLRCLIHRNLSCHSYQHILQVFVRQFDHMTWNQKHVVVAEFVLPFLSRPRSGPGCVNGSDSAEWLKTSLGPFSRILPLGELLRLNPRFSPLKVLRLLTPKQSAELLLSTLPALPGKEVVIDRLFDSLTEVREQEKLPEFLFFLVMFLPQGNLSCSAYKTLFDRLDEAMTEVSLDVASNITYSKIALSRHIPPGCIIYSGKLSALTAEDLAAMLLCNRSSNSSGSGPVWKLLLSKASRVLDGALDLLTNKAPTRTVDPRNPALPTVLDSVRELRLDILNAVGINDPALVRRWFHRRLRPLLPAASSDFLSCLATRELNCSTYQHIVQILSLLRPNMTLSRQRSVYVHFIKVFLNRNNTADPGCSSHTNNSGEWLRKNLGGFSELVSFRELQMLRSNFSAMEALPQLTVRQLAEMSAAPGQLTSAAQVNIVMKHVPGQWLPAFFDQFSPAIMVVFDRANLSSHSVGDSAVSLWLRDRLRPLLYDLSPRHVAPFFGILAGRNCSVGRQGVMDLNSTISSLSEQTDKEIHNHIVQMLRGPVPLHCYGDHSNRSYYGFLESTFMGFQFPNLTTFLLLMPHDRMHELVNSIPPSHLGDFLRRPGVVDSDAQLCVLYGDYMQTPMFLEAESVPAALRPPTLTCVWPAALRSSERSQVDAWFDRRLRDYLVFLTKSLISPDITHNASCVVFQKLVSVLGDYNYTAADFGRRDVFDSVRAYLTSATVPRCYNSSQPELNSTAWFAEYIGPFMRFLTLEDLRTFGSTQVLQVFTVNPLNIALLDHSALPLNLTNYYTELVYQQDGNFSPLLLPLVCRCVAPGAAFSQLTEEQTVIMLDNLTAVCTNLDPQISAALAGNFGDNIDATAIAALGNESSGLSTGQIKTIKPEDLIASLAVLGSITGWNEGQAKAIIQALLSSGKMQINGSSTLFMLGSLVVGVPASVFGGIDGSQLVAASKDSAFLVYMMSAPQISRQTFVTQIVSLNSNGEAIIENVPDEMATEIPRALLLGFSGDSEVITKLNQKKWKRQQVELFFSVIALESSTAELGGANNLSSSVLQGFTCTGVRTIRKAQVKKLVKACRRKGKRKVKLVESQLTCMYNYIRDESDATSFDLYPPDVLLYYDYSLVPQAACRSYFEQLADADFSVFSSALSYKRTDLFANARSCLGITNTSLTKDDISVLGSMCCTLDGSYIENSDPSVLEKLKACPDLTVAQASAAQTLLLSGKTPYGTPSNWDQQTLEDLGMLPLYMTSTFYNEFDKYFLKLIRSNGVDRRRRRTMKKEIQKSIRKKSKRSIVDECTVGTITQVTISGATFPFDYDDVAQFNCCLSAATVKDNLDAITAKVDEEEYLRVVLSKLNEAYAANATIPEDQVQLLGPASRVASVDDITKWSITQVDTLSALMDSSNGQWEPSQAKAVVSRYLSAAGNKLGSAELNSVGGANLCSLDVDVLKNISQRGLKDADALDVSSCTTEKKKELFIIARQAFAQSTRATVPVSTYQLLKAYSGGATLADVRSWAASNVDMDMATFTNLDQSVVLSLTVNEVKGLLGSNLANLKSYENQTLVQRWTTSQYQSELDTLGLGLTGAPGSTAAPGSTGSTAAPGSTGSTASTSTTTATVKCCHLLVQRAARPVVTHVGI